MNLNFVSWLLTFTTTKTNACSPLNRCMVWFVLHLQKFRSFLSHSYLMLRSANSPATCCFTNVAAKSFILSCIICLYEKVKNYLLQSFKECLFFVFCLFFFFLLLSSNTLHVMVNTCICYWNTFQFKYIVEITFYVVKKFHVRLTSKDICFFLIFV